MFAGMPRSDHAYGISVVSHYMLWFDHLPHRAKRFRITGLREAQGNCAVSRLLWLENLEEPCRRVLTQREALQADTIRRDARIVSSGTEGQCQLHEQ